MILDMKVSLKTQLEELKVDTSGEGGMGEGRQYLLLLTAKFTQAWTL